MWSGEAGSESNVPPSGAAFDPATGGGARSPTRRSAVEPRRPAVWTGDEMLVWGGSFTDPDDDRPGLAYDPAADTWRELPPAPVCGHRVPGVGVDRDRDGRGRRNPRRWRDRGADGDRLRPGVRPLAAVRRAALALVPAWPTAVWTGDEVIVWGGQHDTNNPDSRGAALDPATGRGGSSPTHRCVASTTTARSGPATR